jgi:hypothetical protein
VWGHVRYLVFLGHFFEPNNGFSVLIWQRALQSVAQSFDLEGGQAQQSRNATE